MTYTKEEKQKDIANSYDIFAYLHKYDMNLEDLKELCENEEEQKTLHKTQEILNWIESEAYDIINNKK